MRREDADALEEMEREHELSELVRRARRALSMGRPDQAARLAEEATAVAPDSTTVHELLGDVAMAQGNVSVAREHYERALEIEPANADAEEKLAEIVLRLGSSERLKQRMTEVVENPEEYRSFTKNPVVAAFYSVIPGLGQLYNQQYEKGLALAASAMLLLAWVLSKILAYHGAALIAGARNPNLDTKAAQQVIEGYGPLMWTLISLAIVAYLGIWIYSIWDAYHTCAEMQREADEFGVEAPGQS